MTHLSSGPGPLRRASSLALKLAHSGLLSVGFAALLLPGGLPLEPAGKRFAHLEMTEATPEAALSAKDATLGPDEIRPLLDWIDPGFKRSAAAPTVKAEPIAKVESAKIKPSIAALAYTPIDGTSVIGEEVALSEEMQRVRDWVARRYRVSSEELEPALAQAEDSARSAGLDPLLIVAMMAIESSFNPFAESHMGAQGLMQVIPRFHRDKMGENAGKDALFDPVFNVQVGTQVLVEGIRRFGDLQAALQYYGGARNDPNLRYSRKVLTMRDRISGVARDTDVGG